MPSSKVLAFGASNSRTSINRRFALHAAGLLQAAMPGDLEIDAIDLNDFEMPIYSIDRQNAGGIPDPAHRFFAKVGAADAVIISFAEHNGSYASAYRNIFDWCSRIDQKVYQGKPMLVLATSVGKNGGTLVFQGAVQTLPFFGAQIAGQFNFGPFHDHYDAQEDAMKTAELASELAAAVEALKTAMAPTS